MNKLAKNIIIEAVRLILTVTIYVSIFGILLHKFWQHIK